MKRICAVTSTRADYGLLYWILKRIESDVSMRLDIVVTGTHLSPAFGMTVRDIERDGFTISASVEMLLSSDSRLGTAKSIGLGVIGLAEAFSRLQPDLLLLLGDRFEILAAAEAATVLGIPIAHVAGGDTTEGAFDEAIRHSVTKMSHLHFVTNDESARRVRQMGENPLNVFNVGSPGLDYVRNVRLLSREELEASLDFRFRDRNVLITFHPSTLDPGSPSAQIEELLLALDRLGPAFGLLFTKGNADPGSEGISTAIDAFVASHENAAAYVSLGQIRYLSAIAAVDLVAGNSSSGLYEVPSFRKPSVDIGNRQRGRLRASSVVSCEPRSEAISAAIEYALNLDCSDTVNPYGKGEASEAIHRELQDRAEFSSLLQKRFVMYEGSL